jgi:2-phosphosulfolactate phosphatase
MTEAMANGARAIYPVLSAEDAIRLATSMGRENTLICGERKGLPIDGFDLGNSPREFTRARVEGKQLVMTTTNGTRAFLAAHEASPVVAASFLNLTAAARAVADADHVVVVCAGKEDQFSYDDALCGGHLVKALAESSDGEYALNDAAAAALILAHSAEPSAALLGGTAAGLALRDINLLDDLPVCAEVDRHDLAPAMVDRVIRLQHRG